MTSWRSSTGTRTLSRSTTLLAIGLSLFWTTCADRSALREASKLVNKTERTIARWKLEGCKLDEESLLLWSEEKDSRARGRSKTRWREREDQAYVASKSSGMTNTQTPTIASYFTDATEHDFIDLPSPVSIERMTRVVVTLDEIRAAFQQRVIELKAIGHAESLEWAEDDLGKIDATIRPIEEVICRFTDEIPRHLWEKHVASLAMLTGRIS